MRLIPETRPSSAPDVSRPCPALPAPSSGMWEFVSCRTVCCWRKEQKCLKSSLSPLRTTSNHTEPTAPVSVALCCRDAVGRLHFALRSPSPPKTKTHFERCEVSTRLAWKFSLENSSKKIFKTLRASSNWGEILPKSGLILRTSIFFAFQKRWAFHVVAFVEGLLGDHGTGAPRDPSALLGFSVGSRHPTYNDQQRCIYRLPHESQLQTKTTSKKNESESI